MAGGASCLAIVVLWPAPARDPLRGPVADACRGLAARLRREVARVLGDGPNANAAANEAAAVRASAAVENLRRTFYATPYRPTGLSTGSRAVVRLVDEVMWLGAIITSSAHHRSTDPVKLGVCEVKSQAAKVLDLGAGLLEVPADAPMELREALAGLQRAREEMEAAATAALPVGLAAAHNSPATDEEQLSDFVTSLDPSFRSQELSFAVSQIAANIDLSAAAERRTWLERLAGRQPPGLTSTLSAAQERAASHVERHSLTLHNSLRGAIGLGLAVLVADLTGVQHSFWVVLGTLSVLRSNALSTGQNVVRGLLGTLVGFVIGAGLVALIGTNLTLLWLLFPLSVLLAGIAPAVVSFAAGQAAFTVVLVILFNIIQPLGWRVGLIRVEDVAIGCAVSLAVGLLFWPRGAVAALGQALADAYTDAARYLSGAVEFAMGRCDSSGPDVPAPTREAIDAAAAARRLDDTFRSYLAERGAKPVPLADMTGLVTGVVALRLAAEAVLDIWRGHDAKSAQERSAARHEVLSNAERVAAWYETLAASLAEGTEVPSPLEPDKSANKRLLGALQPRSSERRPERERDSGSDDLDRRPPRRRLHDYRACWPNQPACSPRGTNSAPLWDTACGRRSGGAARLPGRRPNNAETRMPASVSATHSLPRCPENRSKSATILPW